MGTPVLRIGIAGCGMAARIHLDRLLSLGGVEIVGCADSDIDAARALADLAGRSSGGSSERSTVGVFSDHRELLRQVKPDSLAVFTPHLSHYRLAMDALQAGCHIFIEKPLSTNVQEAADIVGLARGRGLLVAVGHQFRLAPSLREARSRLASGAIGTLRMVTAVLARPWLTTLGQDESNWRFNPKVSGGGILADAGDHLVDALLWTTRQSAREVAAVQSQWDPGIDLVTAAVIRLADGTPVTLAISGISPGSLFQIDYFGEHGRLRATETRLEEERLDAPLVAVDLPRPDHNIDENFVAAIQSRASLCCPADQAIETVRLLEAVARSAATRQMIQLT